MISDQILSFYQSLNPPTNLPSSVEILHPYLNPNSWALTQTFYRKYYEDILNRNILFGINPGRLGGGVTGVPFTDPYALQEYCHIENDLIKRTELSSTFIYQLIAAMGGPDSFYQRFYITAVSPLGYVQDGKNLNYYDIPNWKALFEKYAAQLIEQQLDFSISTKEAFSIGQGENFKFLVALNKKHQFFDKITPLPHPRWVMQYRRKQIDTFIEEYQHKLCS